MINSMFDTIAVGIPLRLYPQWIEMLERHRKNNLFKKGETLVATGGLTWNKFRKQMEGLTTMDKIREVNSLWNRRPWKGDIENWHLEDRWATPLEFCMKGGDCEEYATTKMLSLKELGVDCPMRLVIGKKDGRGHAVLVIQVEYWLYILDNESNLPVPDYQYRNFEPKDSMTEEKAWVQLKHLSTKEVFH